jgi:phage protein D
MPVADLSQPLVPVCDVIINGKSWSAEVDAHVASVSVSENLGLPAMFTLTLHSPAEHENKLPWIEDQSLFAIGDEVKVKLGYGDELETVTTGEITGLDPHFARDRATKLTVRGYDRLHRLLRESKTRTFAQMKDSDIASQIADDAGLTGDVTDSEVTHEYVIQTNKTDLAFLQERARLINYEVMVDDKTLIFRPAANAESESLTLSFEADLLDFSPNLSSAGQVSEARVRGWNPQEKKEIVGQAKAGDEGSAMGGSRSGGALAEEAFGSAASVVADQPVASQAEADQMAKALLQKTALSLVTGSGVCFGRTDLRSGKVIKIEGVGEMFSGKYYVTQVTHSYSPHGGYRTSFSVRRNAV